MYVTPTALATVDYLHFILVLHPATLGSLQGLRQVILQVLDVF